MIYAILGLFPGILTGLAEMIAIAEAIALLAAYTIHGTAEAHHGGRLILFHITTSTRAQPIGEIIPTAAFVDT